MHIETELTRAIRSGAQELGLNQAQLAKRIGVVQSAMVLVLRGMSQPNRKTIRKYARFLGVSAAVVRKMSGGKQTPKTKLGRDGARVAPSFAPTIRVANRTVGEILALAEDELVWAVHGAPPPVRHALMTIFGLK